MNVYYFTDIVAWSETRLEEFLWLHQGQMQSNGYGQD